jgi:16S rRNA (cytosine967-C5)-methyltransferase
MKKPPRRAPSAARPVRPAARPDRPDAEQRLRAPGLPRINAGQKLGASLDLLEAMARSPGGADRVAADWFGANRHFDGTPRGDIMDVVESVLRHRLALDWWIARLGAGLPASNRVRMIASHILIQRREVSSLEAALDGRGFSPVPLDEAEQRFAAALKGHTILHPDMPPAIRLALPDWLEPMFRERFGAAFEVETAALLLDAPVDLRVNALKGDRETVAARLRSQGLVPRTTPLSPLGLRLGVNTDIGRIEALRDGAVEIQDEGSQIAALLVDAQPGEWVVDFCAGTGGKTMVMAGAMQNRGHIVALDVHDKRLVRARQRLRRAGIENAECRLVESRWIKRHAGRAARVLVDAPCTGTGTWRRKPDARWRLTPQDVSELVALQATILDSAERLVKPGGRLVYVTCSLLHAENDAQVQSFLQRHPDFAVLPVPQIWPATVGGACPERGDFLHLTPHRHGVDGFFVAVLERR